MPNIVPDAKFRPDTVILRLRGKKLKLAVKKISKFIGDQTLFV